MKIFIYYIKVIKYLFIITGNIRIPIYIFNTAVFGFLGWYIPLFRKIYIKKASKFQDCIINTKHGKYLCSNFHDLLLMYDNYEPEIDDVIKRSINFGWDVNDENYMINIGCNVGRWAIPCAKIYGYKVIAFEPAPDTFRRLKINTLLSNLENHIETINVGLGDENLIMKFDYVPQFNGISKVILDGDKIEGNVIEVPIKRFDDLCIDDEIINKTRLIIMDVEGFQHHVLKGMEKALLQLHNVSIIIEIWNDDKDKDKTIDFMKKLGYSVDKIDKTNRLFSK